MAGRPRTCRGIVDDYPAIDISDLCCLMQRSHNAQVIWQAYGGEELYAVSLRFEQEPGAEAAVIFAAPTEQERTVYLTSTPQFFGGRRLWFRCPMRAEGSTCERRARLLYVDPALGEIGCRICFGLTYASCRLSHCFDALFSFAERVGQQSDLPSALRRHSMSL